VVDRDGGFLARALVEDLSSQRLDLREMAPDEAAQSHDLVRTLVIPAGFTDGIVAGEKTTVRLEKQPGTNAEAALVAQARILSSISRITGRLIEVASDDERELTETAFSATNGDGDLVTVNSRFAGQAVTAPSGFTQSIPGNTVLFVMLVALTYGAASVTGERVGGQLKRLVTTPASRAEIILGKITGRVAVAVVQVTVLMATAVLANRVLGIYIGEHTVAAYVILLSYAFCVAPLGVAVGARFRDPDRAANIGVLITMVMGALGGCMWPLEFVSPTLQRVSLAFPTGWAMKALHQVISFGRGLGDVVPEIAVMAGFALLFTAVASRSLQVE
jgi:ABC-2 type transport system permease protein